MGPMVLDTSADVGRGQSEEPQQVVVTWGHPHLQTRTPELRGDGLVGSSDPGEQTGGIWAETRLGSQAPRRPAGGLRGTETRVWVGAAEGGGGTLGSLAGRWAGSPRVTPSHPGPRGCLAAPPPPQPPPLPLDQPPLHPAKRVETPPPHNQDPHPEIGEPAPRDWIQRSGNLSLGA